MDSTKDARQLLQIGLDYCQGYADRHDTLARLTPLGYTTNERADILDYLDTRIIDSHRGQRPRKDNAMDFIKILRHLDAEELTLSEATDRLGAECDSAFLAGSYLSCREQRKQLQGRLAAYEKSEWYGGLDRATVESLIEQAYLADAISQGDAFVHLTKSGVPDDTARARLTTLAAIKTRDASRAEYLEHPATAKRYCTVCGRQVVADALSKHALCPICIVDINDAVAVQMQTKQGPYYNAWREGMIRAAHRLADQEIEETDAKRDAGTPLTLGHTIELPHRERDADDAEHYDLGGPQAFCRTSSKYADDAETPRKLSDHIDQTHECDDDCANCAVKFCSMRQQPYDDTDDDDDADDSPPLSQAARCWKDDPYDFEEPDHPF